MNRTILAAMSVSAALLLSGCGDGVDRPETVPVSGKVLLDGEPLGGALVTMVSDTGGRPAITRSRDDGTFTMTTFVPGDGVIPGRYKITVSKDSETQNTYDAPGDESEDYDGSTDRGFVADAGPKPVVPERYGSAATTDLIAMVETGIPLDSLTLELSR